MENALGRKPQRDYLISIDVYASIYLLQGCLSFGLPKSCVGRHQCPPNSSLSISYPLSLPSLFSLRCSSPESPTSNMMRHCLLPLSIMDPKTTKFGLCVTPSSLLCHAIVVGKKTNAFFVGGAGIEAGVESCVGHGYWVSWISFWNRWRGRWGRHFRSHAHSYCGF